MPKKSDIITVHGGPGRFSILDHGGFCTVALLGYTGVDHPVRVIGCYASENAKWNLERARERIKKAIKEYKHPNSDRPTQGGST